MSPTDKIASEAAGNWCRAVETEGPPLDEWEFNSLVSHIKSACEKAYHQGALDQELQYPPAAHASEQGAASSELTEVIAELEYIAQSPPPEAGGFHPRVVQTAQRALYLLQHPTPATAGEQGADMLWDEKYVDERLGRDASWPQIIEAANYSIRKALSRRPTPATASECGLCDTGFPIDDHGNHIPTQRLGMIPVTRCRKLPPDSATSGKWTVERLMEYFAVTGNEKTFKEICIEIAVAINDALEAEREKHRPSKISGIKVRWPGDEENQPLRSQLEESEKRVDELALNFVKADLQLAAQDDAKLVQEIAQESSVEARHINYTTVQITTSTWEKLLARYNELLLSQTSPIEAMKDTDKISAADKSHASEQGADMKRKIEAAKKLCEIYFNIAAEFISEDEIGRRRDAAIDAQTRQEK